ncbi:MAG: dihydropteroate synthase [Thiomicrorhabdus sp.]|nr:MAG: dihydropteroate synthase [Thiomicrorhabdus sp.]
MLSVNDLVEAKKIKQGGGTLVMGILNVTPDSFYDGGCFNHKSALEERVISMIDAGVDIIDIGGESTRPGAQLVTLDEELSRVMPVIEWITEQFDVAVSIDTYKTEVMRAAIDAGVSLINDVNALQSCGAVEVAAESGVAVCLMHKQGEFASMQEDPVYTDVLSEVTSFLLERVKACEDAGILSKNIILDPGFGFGKTLEHNVDLFRNLEQITVLKYPVLVGVSRKRMIAELLGGALPDNRLVGSVTSAVLAALKGASIVRVHDVKETVDALRIAASLK